MLCYKCMQPRQKDICEHCGFDSSKYQPIPTALEPETVLQGKYVIGMVLGKGGFGITYIGYDRQNRRRVAIKEYFPSTAVVRDAARGCGVQVAESMKSLYKAGVAKFFNEASLLAKLSNIPSIVKVYDFFYENNTAYIVMEYIDGTTIDKIVKHQGPLEIDMVLTIYYPIMEALSKVHAEGILHRDISPSNIMLDDKFNVRLIDFGASRAYSNEMSTDMSVILKNGFAPIEQYTRKGHHSPSEDIYALCASMYYTLTGKIPPSATDRLVFDTLKPLSAYGSGMEIPAPIEQAIMKGMAVKSAERYRTIDEMIAEIDRSVSTEAESVPQKSPASGPVGTPEPKNTPSPASSDKAIWLAVGAAAVALAVIGALLVIFLSPTAIL